MTQSQLRPIRQGLGLTLEQLSLKTGISQGRLSLIEAGANVTVQTLEKIVEALNHEIRIMRKEDDHAI